MIAITTIKGMTSNQLLKQYETAYDTNHTAYYAMDEQGADRQMWCDEYERSSKDVDNLIAEIRLRKAKGTLYDGKRDAIVKVWAWAKGKAKNDKHLYNIVRNVMVKKGVVMLRYEYRGIFA